jgi:gamma-butyrobetaine dioxygenase
MNAGVEEILEPLRIDGRQAYLGEPVSITDHLLQSAHAAEQDGAESSLIVAALLHDIGWLLRSGPRRHEARGAAFLVEFFGPAVTEPIRLHVAAKRYLCTVDRGYHDTLSNASKRTLLAQGGTFNESGLAAFSAEPFAHDAVQLRHYDDRGKIPGRSTPDLAHYAMLVEAELCR